MALACAPATVSANSHPFIPTTNGLMTFPWRLFDIGQRAFST
jgi:hypothetical protein